MKKKAWPAFLALAMGVLTIALATGAQAGEARTLRGEYMVVDSDDRGQLEAVFTPTGDATWDVDFHFDFQGQAHTYSGIAEGSFAAGGLTGTVRDERQRRTFSFTGTYEAGTFQGSHAEIASGGEEPTGTMTLRESE